MKALVLSADDRVMVLVTTGTAGPAAKYATHCLNCGEVMNNRRLYEAGCESLPAVLALAAEHAEHCTARPYEQLATDGIFAYDLADMIDRGEHEPEGTIHQGAIEAVQPILAGVLALGVQRAGDPS